MDTYVYIYIYIYDSDDIISYHIMQKSDIEITIGFPWFYYQCPFGYYPIVILTHLGVPRRAAEQQAGLSEKANVTTAAFGAMEAKEARQLFCFETAEVTLWETYIHKTTENHF